MPGPGTGLDESGVARKRAVIAAGPARHRAALARRSPRGLAPSRRLRHRGAGLGLSPRPAGAIPVLVDGFIASVAAALAVGVGAAVGEWLYYTHRSAEPGHDR
ncbi:MAG: nicotinate-nucleotide--dimethylbenzimidazole phosphoribosyltransferase [Gammaproteobacteria bacterium]